MNRSYQLCMKGIKLEMLQTRLEDFISRSYYNYVSPSKNVKYVCSEYIEDVDVFFEDNTFEFIQVKYYPKTSPYMKEILTDLYYQYLRLEMLQSTLKVSPKLYIHGKSKVKKLEITDMKTYIGLENNLHKSASYLNVAESVNLLRTDIYSTNKKSEQKKSF